MKLVFLASSAAILYLMRGAKGIRQTYDAAHDTFRVAFLVAPAALLAFALSADRSSAMETAWTFSILLEAVAILPQLVLLQRTGNVDNLTGDCVSFGNLPRSVRRQLVLPLDDGARVQAVAR